MWRGGSGSFSRGNSRSKGIQGRKCLVDPERVRGFPPGLKQVSHVWVGWWALKDVCLHPNPQKILPYTDKGTLKK